MKLIVFLTFLLIHSSVAGDEKIIFSTWDTFEVDKCASIWLIKRHIAPQAEIRFFKRGEPITEGIEFDTPSAKFRRYHNQSTYETLLEYYKLKDEKLVYLGRIIHDIEINVWEKKMMPETPEMERAVSQIVSSPDNKNIIEQCYQYFSNYDFPSLNAPK